MEKGEIKIVEYGDKYKEQIIAMIGGCMVDQGVHATACQVVEDDDLQDIPKKYSGRGKFWVAIDGEKVVGTVGVREYEGDMAKLRRMFVQKEYRGTGLAKQLLGIALQFAKEMNYKKITLNTHVNMQRAHSFYKKNNFIFVGNKNSAMISFKRSL
jgi:GNAT superfamily N-acetyltransferase